MGWDNSFQSIITLPTGATTGERIVLDGVNGRISIYDASNTLVAEITDTGEFHTYGIDTGSGQPIPIMTTLAAGSLEFQEDPPGTTGDPSFMTLGYNGKGVALTTYYHAASAAGCNAPSMDLTSESSPGGADSDMELGADVIRLLGGDWTFNNRASLGQGILTQDSITAGVNFSAETALITAPSAVWKSGRAYRVSIVGLVSAATATNYALLRLRKGTGTGGAIWRDQMRVSNLPAFGTPGFIALDTILVNNTAADITAALTLTGSQGTTAQTWTWGASAGAVSYLVVEDIGSAAQWPGQPIT